MLKTALLTALMVITSTVITPAAENDPYRPPAMDVTSVPAVPKTLMDQLRQYQSVRNAAFRGWSPDGKGILIQTQFGNTSQLHRVYEPGGRREQMTFLEEPTDGTFLKGTKDGTLLLQMSVGGNENNQLLRYDREDGRVLMLTDGKSRHSVGPQADDGSFLIISHNARNGRDMDIFRMDPRNPASPEKLMEAENELWNVTDMSKDKSKLLMAKYVSINESYPAVFDIATKTRTPIPPPPGSPAKVAFGELAFAPDGKTAYVACDAKSEFQELAVVDLATFEYKAWLTSDIPWNIDGIEVDEKTGSVAFTTNTDGASDLYLIENGQRRKLDTPLGIIDSLKFNDDGTQLGFTLSKPNAPADAYSISLKDGRLTRWTYSEVGGLNPDRFVVPQRVQFPSFDNRTIPAYVFKPKAATAKTPAPVLINIHGGPESQYRPIFTGFDQLLLNELGIAVIRPNVRGSNGYGKTYLQLDNAEKREDSVKDIGALLDWIATQPDLDKNRVAVYGGSYGGYMVLASLTHFPDRIKAGVDVVGIANFVTFLKNTSEYRRDLRRAEYGDERDPEMLKVFERINPSNNAHKIRSALMVAHGKNDPRVPFSEAELIAPLVRKNNAPVWTVYADNEGHGFAKRDNRDYVTAVTAMFLKEFLLTK
ncbi:MAG TPA: alpha/beta fold hydrolase [Caulifigura sp.]|jgi:dipeptidyl aminopeptidase/acylaminoacyl peptidase|nr:alpha/beta fold hydrolase [Caulifigura sp.]